MRYVVRSIVLVITLTCSSWSTVYPSTRGFESHLLNKSFSFRHSPRMSLYPVPRQASWLFEVTPYSEHVEGQCRTRSPLQVRCSSLIFAQQMVDSITGPPLDSLKLRNPYMAIFYSFVPGIIVHGSGHFYAGDSRTGTRLLLAEAAGGGLIFVGIVLTMAGVQTEAGFAVLSGAILFVGSWVYDVVRSPLVVKKHNKELLDRKQGQLRFRTKDGDLRLELVWRF